MNESAESLRTLPDVLSDFVYRETNVQVTATPRKMCGEAANRVFLSIWLAPTAPPINVSTNSQLNTTTGVAIVNQDRPFQLNSGDHPSAVGAAWYGLTMGASNVTVLEIFYLPKG